MARSGGMPYLLKPITEEKLTETMQGAWKVSMEQIKNEEKYENWEKLLVKDSDSFLQVVVQKYVQNRIPAEKADQVFDTLEAGLEKEDRFITVYVDVDLAYKITNSLNYEAARFAMMQMLEELIGTQFSYWKLENEEGTYIFIIRARENKAVGELKEVLETVKERAHPVVAAISKPYKGIGGIKRSYEEAQKLFELASMAGASAFTIPRIWRRRWRKPIGRIRRF